MTMTSGATRSVTRHSKIGIRNSGRTTGPCRLVLPSALGDGPQAAKGPTQPEPEAITGCNAHVHAVRAHRRLRRVQVEQAAILRLGAQQPLAADHARDRETGADRRKEPAVEVMPARARRQVETARPAPKPSVARMIRRWSLAAEARAVIAQLRQLAIALAVLGRACRCIDTLAADGGGVTISGATPPTYASRPGRTAY